MTGVASYRHAAELDSSEPDTRPGFYYVSCRNSNGQYAFVRGPWINDHAGALAAKFAVQREAERVDPKAIWYAWGTARSEDDKGEGVLGGPIDPAELLAKLEPPPAPKPAARKRARKK